MTSPHVSVIVPIYKVQDYLDQCISSIVQQTLKNIEIILVDEGDDDECYAIMRKFSEKDSRVKIIHEKSGGYAASCNKGFDLATGEYLCVIESDDFIELTMLEDLYATAKKYDLDVIKCPFSHFYDARNNSPSYRTPCNYASYFEVHAPSGAFTISEFPELMAVHASVWSAIYRASFIKEKKIYFLDRKPSAYVDVEFRIRTLVEAKRIGWHPTPFYNWRMTNPTSTNNTFNLSMMIQRWREAHDYFNSCEGELYYKIGPYSILDEFLNVYSKMYLPFAEKTNQNFRDAKAILDKIPPDIYLNSPILTEYQKAQMKAFANAKTMQDLDVPLPPRSPVWPWGEFKGRGYRKYLKYSPIRIRLRRKEIGIRLLIQIPIRICSVSSIFFNGFSINFSIGR